MTDLQTYLMQPIITLVLYYGEEPWSGPVTLKDMIVEMQPEIKQLIMDYKIILVQVRSDEEYAFQNDEVSTIFRTARKIFAGEIEEVKKEYEKVILSSEVLGMIGTITGSKKIINIAEEKGNMNMCKALDEYWDKAKQEGHKEGHKEGYKEERRSIVIKMMENNLPEETICVVTALTKKEVQEIRSEMC